MMRPEAFRQALAAWFQSVRRALPWREQGDPYRIWLSEIMLQQTRVDQATPYFERFIDAFPTVESLASADLDEVLLKWEGLGYYARARNLHRAARFVVDRLQGRLPESYDEWLALPGVGPYTAAAVASIAFAQPHAVLDGNVIRVLTRFFALDQDVNRAQTRRDLQQLAQSLLDRDAPGDHNEAMMELGAVVCRPKSPHCDACPVRTGCSAAASGTQSFYPVKAKRAPVPHYHIAIGVISRDDGAVLVQRRPEDGLLGGLWEFPGGKCEPEETPQDACRRELYEELGVGVAVGSRIAEIPHAYSHFRITLHAFPCRIIDGYPVSATDEPMQWVQPDRLGELAFPRANRRLIDLLDAASTG